MGAVIATESTSWDRVGKEVEVSIEVSNYTKKARDLHDPHNGPCHRRAPIQWRHR